jgi:hypothetical protein
MEMLTFIVETGYHLTHTIEWDTSIFVFLYAVWVLYNIYEFVELDRR